MTRPGFSAHDWTRQDRAERHRQASRRWYAKKAEALRRSVGYSAWALQDTVRCWVPSDVVSMVPLRGRNGIQGFVLVDRDDYDVVAQHKWSLARNGYACGYVKGDERSLLMHRFLMGLKKGDGLEVDHLNLRKLDNRRSNLRIVHPDDNKRNRRCRRGAAVPYRGVFPTESGRFQAKARFRGQIHSLGTHGTAEGAAEAVNRFWVDRGHPAPNEVAA